MEERKTNMPTPTSCTAFTISLDDSDGSKAAGMVQRELNLQKAFEKFKKTRQNEIRSHLQIRRRMLSQNYDREKMWSLRMKFLETAKSYLGYPYSRKEHADGSELHSYPFSLDCCALVRQAIRDLRAEFGFTLAGWNQAYQYDTLPIRLTERQMKPGDLVFISGKYYTKKRKQIHNMCHVEIWMGDGPKTLGSRWRKGVVSVFDSYAFVPKSYRLLKFHFRSIDTWLAGICRSFCKKHPWRRGKTVAPLKRSIFRLDHQQETQSDVPQQLANVVQYQEPADFSDESSVMADDPSGDISQRNYEYKPTNNSDEAPVVNELVGAVECLDVSTTNDCGTSDDVINGHSWLSDSRSESPGD